MRISTHINEALRQLTASKLRAFLAMLGIMVGTASVVAMVSIGKLAEDQILSQFTKLGINLLSVNISSSGGNVVASNTLSTHHAQAIPQAITNVSDVAPYFISFGQIVYQGNRLEGSSVGVTPAIFDLAKLTLLHGRRLSFLDKNDYYCVIGNKLYQKILSTHSHVLGTQIEVGKMIFTIVGVLAPWPSNFFFQSDFNSAVIIPLQTALKTLNNAQISNLAIRVHDTTLIHHTEQQIKQYIQQHTYGETATIQSPKSLIDSMQSSSNTMTLLLGMIGSISLLVGGIGVMNVMLVSVAERHREIGLRLAIGARQQDIQMQFLIESITLAIFGGLSGMLLGIAVTLGVSLYSHWHFHLYLLPPLVGALISILVGVFFGFYPARKASKLNPIQTLRSE